MVVAALSGGVDSAAAAALLVADGWPVVGMTMRLYDARGSAAATGRCCGPRDIEDARRVCSHLGIPFYVVDFTADFERDVIDDFVGAYLQGETPNPCVKCNQHIKFTPLLRRARALGAEAVVTGHYARLEPDGEGGLALRRAVDAGKDQSYFLFSMPAEELHAVRFPLGGMTKEQVRARARALGLPNADKPESQEICFVPDGDHAGFVARRALTRGRQSPPDGELVDAAGRVVGRHPGIHRYTIGQRRGLGPEVGAALAAPGTPVEPAYVTAIDPVAHRVTVGPRDAAARSRLRVRDLRWLSRRPAGPLSCAVQIRHRAPAVPAEILVDGGGAEVRFAAEVVAAPGQAAVFYDGDRVLGGGWIAPAG